MQNKYTPAVDPVNFELINKTNNTFQIALCDQSSPTIDTRFFDAKGIKPNAFIPADINSNLIIDDKATGASVDSEIAAMLYKFPPYPANETFYIQLTPTGLNHKQEVYLNLEIPNVVTH